MSARRRAAVVLACLGAAVLLAPGSTGAFFTDGVTAGGNPVAAGTVDTTLSEVGPATEESTTDETSVDATNATWRDESHVHKNNDDRDETVTNTLRVGAGESSLAVEEVNVTVDYAEHDGQKGDGGNADATARSLEVTQLRYAGQDLLGSTVVDENGNGMVDLQDLTLGDSSANLSDLDGFGVGGSADLTLSLDGDPSAFGGGGGPGNGGGGGGRVRGEGVAFTLTIRSTASGFVDADHATDNVVVYG